MDLFASIQGAPTIGERATKDNTHPSEIVAFKVHGSYIFSYVVSVSEKSIKVSDLHMETVESKNITNFYKKNQQNKTTKDYLNFERQIYKISNLKISRHESSTSPAKKSATDLNSCKKRKFDQTMPKTSAEDLFSEKKQIPSYNLNDLSTQRQNIRLTEIFDLTQDEPSISDTFTNMQHLPDFTQEYEECQKPFIETLKEENDCESIAKIQLLIMPAQNGKTKICIDMITDEIALDSCNGRSLHFVFTQNTSTNQEQFFRRLPTDKTVTFGTKILNTEHAKNLDELKGKTMFSAKNPQIIVMCAHSKRFEDIKKICQMLAIEDNDKCKRIFIYIDEIHEYINNKDMRNMVEILSECPSVKSIVGLTATPDKVFEIQETDPFWKQIMTTNLQELSNVDLFRDDYYSLHQHTFVCVDMHKRINVIEYAKDVMSSRENDFFSYGCITFVPANISQKSHVEMMDMIFQLSPLSVVIMLNGNSKCIYFKKDGFMTVQSFSKHRDELSKIIPKLISEHRLFGRPLFITGNKCIKVGVSLACPELGNFTASIISHHNMHYGRQDDLYQMTARTAGNMKNWFSFKQTRIFCPSNVQDIVLKKESEAFTAKKIAMNYGSIPISKQSIEEENRPENYFPLNETHPIIQNKTKGEIHCQVFDTDEDAIQYISANIPTWKVKRHTKNADGQYEETIHELKGLSVQQILDRKWGINQKTKHRKIYSKVDNKFVVMYLETK